MTYFRGVQSLISRDQWVQLMCLKVLRLAIIKVEHPIPDPLQSSTSLTVLLMSLTGCDPLTVFFAGLRV